LGIITHYGHTIFIWMYKYSFILFTYFISLKKLYILISFCLTFLIAQAGDIHIVLLDPAGKLLNSTSDFWEDDIKIDVKCIELNQTAIEEGEGRYLLEITSKNSITIEVNCNVLGSKTMVVNPDQTQVTIKMDKNLILKDEVRVFGLKNTTDANTSQNIGQISESEIRDAGKLSLSEALTKIPGVNILSTGTAITKPVIRGFSGNRIQVNLSGVRFDNQQWQDEHGLGITSGGVERVEIIKGPASVLYGADALGGVVNVVDENKDYTAGKTKKELNTSINSNTRGFEANYGIKKADENKSQSLYFGLESHGDYSDGRNIRVLNSRFNNFFIKGSMGRNRLNFKSIYTAYINYNQMGFIFDSAKFARKEVDNRISRTMDGPHHSVIFGILTGKQTWVKDKYTFLLKESIQSNNRQEQEAGNKISLNMLLSTVSLTGQFEYTYKKWKNNSGFQFYQQSNNNFGSRTIIPDGIQSESGIFHYIKRDFNKWTVEAGVRGDVKLIKTLATSDLNTKSKDSISPFTKTKLSGNASLGAVYRFNSFFYIKGHLATGYRAGNFAELSSNGLHEGTQRWEVGNPNLKIEQMVNSELGFYGNKKNISFFITPYYNLIKNFIYLAPTNTEYVGFKIYTFNQSDAIMKGIDASLDYNLDLNTRNRLLFNGIFSMIRGQIQATNQYLPFMPADKVGTSVGTEYRLNQEAKMVFKVGADYFLKQNRPAVFETATPDYYLLNASVKYSKILDGQKQLNCMLIGNNLLNRIYYDHLSRFKYFGINNYGINLTLKINYQF